MDLNFSRDVLEMFYGLILNEDKQRPRAPILLATILLGGVGGAFTLASSGLIIASIKLDSKIKKHQEIVMLAIAKRDTVDRLLYKALADNQIIDGEFQLIMTEFSQYNVLKDAVRAKLTWQSSRPHVEKIKEDIRSEIETEFRKK